MTNNWLEDFYDQAILNFIVSEVFRQMNTTTQIKIQQNSKALFDMADFLRAHPDQVWMFDLLDEPFQLAIRIIEMGVDEDPRLLSRQLGRNWQTIKQVQTGLKG